MNDLHQTVSYYRNKKARQQMTSLFESSNTSPIVSTDGHDDSNRDTLARQTQNMSY
jgi:hypothetical protein